ncbi:MAG: glycosyltransferase [Patescibacteria group bacterium]
MKIALANNLYYPYNRGGAESVVKQMIAALKAAGHEVFLITTEPKNESTATPPEIITKDGLKTYYFPSGYMNLADRSPYLHFFWHFNNLFSFHRSAAIKKVLLAEKTELIITHNLMGLGFYLPVIIRKLKIRHEHYLHDIQLLYPSGLMLLGHEKIVDNLSAKLYQLFTRAFFASPAKVSSPSFWLLGQYRQRGFFHDSETEIRNMGTESATQPARDASGEIKPAETDPRSAQKMKNFLFVGQIESHKGIILLIKAFISACETDASIRLSVVGDGILLDEAKALAAANERISFLGRLDAGGVRDLMVASDCLVVPSLCYENAPTTIFEAHSVGLPVLASNIGGIPEIVNEQDKLFRAGDFMDLKNNILNLSQAKQSE